jgi:hypothetical protein
MPYDPTPVGPHVDAHGRRDALPGQVAGGAGEPERVLVLGRPHDGLVDVRETEGALAPREYVERVAVLRQRFERAHRERRRLSEDLHLIRRWPDGQA